MGHTSQGKFDALLTATTNRRIASVNAVKSTAGTILKGRPVYLVGWSATYGVATVEYADANDRTKMPAIGITDDQLTETTVGQVIISGIVNGTLDTSSWSAGDSLYVSATVGTLTNVRPQNSDEQVQKIGNVLHSDASAGEIVVSGSGRTNDEPNPPRRQHDNSVIASYDLTSEPYVRINDVVNVQNSDFSLYLPPANANPSGTRFLVINSDGTCSSPANIFIVCNGGVGHPSPGTDTFNGGGGYTLNTAYAALDFETDGAGKYTRIT